MTSTVKVDLPAEIFDVQTNVPLLHQVVVAQLAAARQGTHKTKTRAEVSGAGPGGETARLEAWVGQDVGRLSRAGQSEGTDECQCGGAEEHR